MRHRTIRFCGIADSIIVLAVSPVGKVGGAVNKALSKPRRDAREYQADPKRANCMPIKEDYNLAGLVWKKLLPYSYRKSMMCL